MFAVILSIRTPVGAGVVFTTCDAGVKVLHLAHSRPDGIHVSTNARYL